MAKHQQNSKEMTETREKEQVTGSKHDGRVAGIGAAGDGGDDDRAVRQVTLLALVNERHFRRQLVFRDGKSLETNLWDVESGELATMIIS